MFFLHSNNNHNQTKNRKGEIFPADRRRKTGGERIFLTQCCRKKGSMTVETSLALPLLLFFLLTILQFATIQTAASALLAGMHETSKEMAVYAYVQEMGLSKGDSLAGEIITGGITAAYAKGRILERAGKRGQNGTFHLFQSAILKNELIDLVGNYKPSHTFTIFPVKKVNVILRARVRAWTGREGTGRNKQEGEKEDNEDSNTVYVTETGKVYHKDPNCSHIKLSISTVSRADVSKKRNRSGGKYHACEKCGNKASGNVYIAATGDKFHTSLECSGLKRTVHECKESDLDGMRACSRCGGG